jgi:hypothetical protein
LPLHTIQFVYTFKLLVSWWILRSHNDVRFVQLQMRHGRMISGALAALWSAY